MILRLEKTLAMIKNDWHLTSWQHSLPSKTLYSVQCHHHETSSMCAKKLAMWHWHNYLLQIHPLSPHFPFLLLQHRDEGHNLNGLKQNVLIYLTVEEGQDQNITEPVTATAHQSTDQLIYQKPCLSHKQRKRWRSPTAPATMSQSITQWTAQQITQS